VVLAEHVPQAYGTAFAWSPAGDAVTYVANGSDERPGQVLAVGLDGRRTVLYDGSAADLGNE
jgi:hypothetical protein